MQRNLTPSEIDDICNALRSTHPEDFVAENARCVLRKGLENLQIYPDMIAQLKAKIVAQYNRSTINPCEMVGCIASTSIGETTTQASLNSFHSSGMAKANLTTGVVRLKELLSATKNNKTPSLTLNFNGENRKDLATVRRFCHSFVEQVRMKDLIQSFSVEKDPELDKWYKIWNKTHGRSYSDCDWRMRLRLDKNLLWSCGKSLRTIVDICDSHINSAGYIHWVYSPTSQATIDIWASSNILPNVADSKAATAIDVKLSAWLDKKEKALMMLKNVVKPHLDPVIISGLRDLEKCYYTQLKDGTYSVETKGGSMIDLPLLCNASYNGVSVDIKRSWSNNMWEIFDTLGVEATVAFLHSEFAKNISVSRRHLELLIDWMTNSGTIQSVSRYGLDIAKVGPLSKASFEQPLDAFFEAANSRQRETITGVSAAVATGNLAKGGTGGFHLLLDAGKLVSGLRASDEQESKNIQAESINDLQETKMEGEGEEDEEEYFRYEC
jgi:hypothetical protein